MDGARNMLLLELGARVAAGARQKGGGVDQLQIGRAELPLQPFGRNQRVHTVSCPMKNAARPNRLRNDHNMPGNAPPSIRMLWPVL